MRLVSWNINSLRMRQDPKAARIGRDMRAWKQPSDHVAVILDF